MRLRAIVGGLLVLPSLLGSARAATLTAAEIEERLRPIPMFVLTDASGAPLVANGSFGVFTERSEAEVFLRVLKAQKPELASQVIVTAIPLSEIVRLTGPGSALQPEFVGSKAERDAAGEIRPKDAEPIGNAPVFVVRAGTAYLTVSREGRSLIPVFFSKKEADDVVARYSRDKQGQTAHVDVSSLESILNAMIMADDPDVGRISLVPSEAMMAGVPHAEGRPKPAPARPPAAPPAAPAPRH